LKALETDAVNVILAMYVSRIYTVLLET